MNIYFTIWLMVLTIGCVQFYSLGQQDVRHFSFVFRPSGSYVWKTNTWNYKSQHVFTSHLHYKKGWYDLQTISKCPENVQNIF